MPGSPQANALNHLRGRFNQLDDIAAHLRANPVTPAWWQVRTPGYFSADAAKFKDIASKWRWDKVLGIDGARNLNTLNQKVFEAFRAGTTIPAPKWMYFGGAATSWGWTTGVFGLVANPSTMPGDSRTQWPWADASYAHLTSARPL